MAARLADAVVDLPGLRITRPVQTNVVFASLPADVAAALRRQFMFYVWDESRDEVRWMCSWDTTEDDVETFAEAVRDALG
jgi:threonine aldolase